MKSFLTNILLIIILPLSSLFAENTNTNIVLNLKDKIDNKADSTVFLLNNSKKHIKNSNFEYLLAYYHFKEKNYLKSKKIFLKISKNTDIENDSLLYDIFFYLGRCYYKLSEPDSSIAFFRKQLNFEKINNLKTRTADSYFFIGYNYQKIGNQDSLMLYYNKAGTLFREKNDNTGIAKTQANLGNFFRSFDPVTSIKHYIKALEIYEKENNKKNIAIINQNIGTVFIDIERYQLSIDHLKVSYKYFEENAYTQYQITCLNNIAYAYINLKEYNKAKETLNKSISLNQDYEYEKTYSILNLAACELGLKYYSNAITKYLEAESLAKKYKIDRIIPEIYSGLAKSYAHKNDLVKFEEYFFKYQETNTDYFEKENRKSLAEYEKSFEVKNLNHKLKIAQRDKKIKTQEIEQQNENIKTHRIIISLGIITIFLLLLYLSSIYKSNKKQKILNISIQKRNAVIENNNIELENIVENRTKELVIAKEKAEESDILKSAFLANISHEIRTPLNSIMGFSDLLTMDNFDHENTSQYGEIIRKNGFELLNMINDIIDVSKIEANSFPVNNKYISLAKISEIIENDNYDKAKYFNKEDNIEFESSFENESLYIYSDINKINIVFDKLINNAFQFTEKGFVEIGSDIKNSKITFYVKDSGNGISETRINEILQNFRKFNKKDNTQYRGLGVGLFIANSILIKLGSKLEINSNKENGSIFSFTFDLHLNNGHDSDND